MDNSAGDTFVKQLKDAVTAKSERDAIKNAPQRVSNAASDVATKVVNTGKNLIDRAKFYLSPDYNIGDKAPDGPHKPSYKHGTDYVPKTGDAKLHKGEAVLNKEDADKYRATKGKHMSEKSHGSSRASHVLGGKGKSKSKSSSKKHPHHLTISHGKSGGHKVIHSFEPDEDGMTQPDEEHILPDKASLMQHIDENTPDVPAPQAAPPDAAAAGASSAVAPPPQAPPGM